MIDLSREQIRKSIGDTAIGSAFQVSYLSSTQILVQPGNAWFDGLPFTMKDGRDQLVSGSNLSPGILPSFVTITDSTAGKVITFNSGGTTPTGVYDVVITAKEQVITATDDPFLQNANIPETTAQKVRLIYLINVVPASSQTQTPIPYTNDTSGQNLVNKIIITPTSGGNGEALAINDVTGSVVIDGRKVEVTVRNNSGLGGGNPIPNGTSDQLAFTNGKLIDSAGQIYHLNAIFNDVISTQVILRLDKEIGEPDPIFINTVPYTIQKADVYYTDDTNGNPQGYRFWSVGSVDWNSSVGIVHPSRVVDLRERVVTEQQFDVLTNEKYTINTINGGTLSLGSDGSILSWNADINLVAPSLNSQTISTGSSFLLDGGFLVYELNLTSGGVISKGNLSVTTTSTGTVISLSGSPNLSSVSKGNVIKVGANSAYITSIDNVNKVLVVSSSLSTSGSGTIYLDSYGPQTYITDENTYPLATKSGSLVTIGNKLTLAPGGSGKFGSSSGTGITKVTLYNPVSTSLPSGSSVTIDGVAGSNGDEVLFTNLSSGNNEVYQLGGVGTSITWTPLGVFNGQLTPSIGDLVIFTEGVDFVNQIAEFNGTTFLINNTVRYFNGTDFWELSSIQSTTLVNNTSGNIFAVTALGSENIIVDFSVLRGSIKETGTIWLTNNGTNAYFSSGGTFSGSTGLTFGAAISGGNVQLNYTLDNSGSSATFKYTVKRWSDGAGGPTGLPSYSPSNNTVFNSAFVMSDNSGTPLNCNPTFNVSGKTRVQLSWNYVVSRNTGTTVSDLDVYVNGAFYPRFVSGVTLDGYFKEISNNIIEFNTDITTSPLSIEIIKKV